MGVLSWVGSKTKKFLAGGIGTSPLTKFGFWRREIEGIKKSDRYNERIIGKARYINVVRTVDATENLNNYMEEIYKGLTEGNMTLESPGLQEAFEGALKECNNITIYGPDANNLYYNQNTPLNLNSIKELWLAIRGGDYTIPEDSSLFREEELHWKREQELLTDLTRRKHFNLAIKLYKIYYHYITKFMKSYGL